MDAVLSTITVVSFLGFALSLSVLTGARWRTVFWGERAFYLLLIAMAVNGTLLVGGPVFLGVWSQNVFVISRCVLAFALMTTSWMLVRDHKLADNLGWDAVLRRLDSMDSQLRGLKEIKQAVVETQKQEIRNLKEDAKLTGLVESIKTIAE